MVHEMKTLANRFPFDWKNPYGYALAVTLQIKIASIPVRFIACFLSLASGCFLFSLSLARDLKGGVHSINENAHEKFTCEQIIDLIRFSNLKRFVLLAQFNAWTKSAINAKTNEIFETFHLRLLSYFTDIYRILLIMLFLGCMVAMLLALLMIQMGLTQVILCYLFILNEFRHSIHSLYQFLYVLFRLTMRSMCWYYLNRLLSALVHCCL